MFSMVVLATFLSTFTDSLKLFSRNKKSKAKAASNASNVPVFYNGQNFPHYTFPSQQEDWDSYLT